MQIKIVSETQNPMLRRKEVGFQVEHAEEGRTPSRSDIRKAVAAALKTDENTVFIKKMETGTGTRSASGTANVYETLEQAKRIEPEYIIKRNIPPEPKPKEEEVKQ